MKCMATKCHLAHKPSGRATLILTLPTCSNAGTMGSATAPGSSRKLPRHPLPRLTTHGLSLPENPQEDGGENLCGNPSGAPLHLNSRGVPLHAAPREPGDQRTSGSDGTSPGSSSLGDNVSLDAGLSPDAAQTGSGTGSSGCASRINAPHQQRAGRGPCDQGEADQAHDVRQGGVCPASSTHSSPHLKTSRANFRACLVFARAFSSPDLALSQQCICR